MTTAWPSRWKTIRSITAISWAPSKGQYGGGTLQLWDRGHWAPEPGFEDIDRALAKGELKFVMEGERLHGGWVIVRLRKDAKSKRDNWLLIKHRDDAAVETHGDALAAEDRSIASGRSMEDIASGRGRAPAPFVAAGKRVNDAVCQRRHFFATGFAAQTRCMAAVIPVSYTCAITGVG